MPSPLVKRLGELGLLRPERDWNAAPDRLGALCDEGYLEGGLSVALNVRPDEVLGPLFRTLGGAARRLKVTDVRDASRDARAEGSPQIRIGVELDGAAETWSVWDVAELVEAVNATLARKRDVRVAVLLGEWNDALQLWCLARRARSVLAQEPALLAECPALAPR